MSRTGSRTGTLRLTNRPAALPRGRRSLAFVTIDRAEDWANVALRALSLDDADRVHEWASQERACRFQAWGPNTWEESTAFVTQAVADWQQPQNTEAGLRCRRRRARRRRHREVLRVSDTCNEIGYAVHTDYWGRGLGTRIARALVSVAFDDRIERVQATCDPRNAASRAVLQRVGMSVEGTLRRTMLLRDGWRDSLMHSVLRSEWPPSSE